MLVRAQFCNTHSDAYIFVLIGIDVGLMFLSIQINGSKRGKYVRK